MGILKFTRVDQLVRELMLQRDASEMRRNAEVDWLILRFRVCYGFMSPRFIHIARSEQVDCHNLFRPKKKVMLEKPLPPQNIALKLTASLHLKTHGKGTGSFSFWVSAYFHVLSFFV